MRKSSEHRIECLLDQNNGVLIALEAIESGIPRNAVYSFVRERGMEKVSPGIFVDADVFPDEIYLLQARYPRVVFSHETALYLHDMADREPVPIALTVESGYHSESLRNQGVKIFYVKPEWYGLGISEIQSPGGHVVRVYDRERTVCDVVRRKAAMDPAAYGYALRSYAASKKKDLAMLGRYARDMGIESQVQEVMEVLL